ncbi:MAG TPA: methyltransferase domain-containing protein [Burkholderiales bacterium]|nr:methyltransferase domain-containing protein [Burkholderiales bacterium]
MKSKLLNIGCGVVCDPAWINLDSAPAAAGVIRHDITKGLPFEDNTFDACYGSHIVEHLTQTQAADLVQEMQRVLRPSGTIRLVVPDLEAMVRLYQQILDELDAGNVSRAADYDWMMLELFDQTSRDFAGGEMGKYLARPDIPNRVFIESRIGDEARSFWDARKKPTFSGALLKLRARGLGWTISFLRARLTSLLILVSTGAKQRTAFETGMFRASGEVHRWMYDRYSLRRLLEQAGYSEISVCSAFESRIPGFESYGLDAVDGHVRKPDSLFMEASKPSRK